MKKLKSRKGMTLVEIVVTIAILAIVSGMGIGIFTATLSNYSTASITSKEQTQALQIEEYIKSYARLATDVDFIPTAASPSDTLPNSGLTGGYIANTKNTQTIEVYNYDGTVKTGSMTVDDVDHIDMTFKRYQIENGSTSEQDFIYLYYKIVMKDGYVIESNVTMSNMDPNTFGYSGLGHVVSGDSFTVGGSSTNTAVVFKIA